MIAGQETSLERAVGACQRSLWGCSVAMSHITQGTGPALRTVSHIQRRNPPLRALGPSPRQDPKTMRVRKTPQKGRNQWAGPKKISTAAWGNVRQENPTLTGATDAHAPTPKREGLACVQWHGAVSTPLLTVSANLSKNLQIILCHSCMIWLCWS